MAALLMLQDMSPHITRSFSFPTNSSWRRAQLVHRRMPRTSPTSLAQSALRRTEVKAAWVPLAFPELPV